MQKESNRDTCSKEGRRLRVHLREQFIYNKNTGELPAKLRTDHQRSQESLQEIHL